MLVENWSSSKWQGSLKAEKPWLAKGLEGSTVCGVGIRKVPSGSLRFRSARATGLMFDPSGLTSVPPSAPAMPPNILPSAAGDLSSVKGGTLRVALQAILG